MSRDSARWWEVEAIVGGSGFGVLCMGEVVVVGNASCRHSLQPSAIKPPTRLALPLFLLSPLQQPFRQDSHQAFSFNNTDRQ